MARGAGIGAVIALASAWLLAAPPSAAAEARPDCRGTLVYFASLSRGPGNGVVAGRFDSAKGRLCPLGLMAEVELPTWVAVHPDRPVLYAVSEIRDLQTPNLFAYRVDMATGRLRPINGVASGGAGPTHLFVDTPSRTMFAAHWISGHVSALPIRSDGGLEPAASVLPGEGGGPAAFQTGPRTHAVGLDPTRRYLFATDIGADRLRAFGFEARTRELTPNDALTQALPPGTGPRHFLFDATGRRLYLIDQLTSDVRLYRWDAAAPRLELVQTVSTTAAGFSGRNDAAAIVLSRDGRFLYVTNRGENTVVLYRVDRASGRLSELQRLASGGKTPRAVAIDRSGRWMLLANQDSNEVRVFSRDPRTGRLAATEQTLSVPLAAGVVFFEH